jgi:hypothetical protein
VAATELTAGVRPAWAEWLGARPWDLFLTLTSDGRTHPEALHKRFRYVAHKMSDHLYGRAVTRRGCPIEYVNAIERHKSGWPHAHALMRLPGVDLADRNQLNLVEWQKFITETGGWCRLEPLGDQANVVSYVTKYVTKDGELILSPNLSPRTDPTPALAYAIAQHGASAAALAR